MSWDGNFIIGPLFTVAYVIGDGKYWSDQLMERVMHCYNDLIASVQYMVTASVFYISLFPLIYLPTMTNSHCMMWFFIYILLDYHNHCE